MSEKQKSTTPPAYENTEFLNVIQSYLQRRRPRDDYRSGSRTVDMSTYLRVGIF